MIGEVRNGAFLHLCDLCVKKGRVEPYRCCPRKGERRGRDGRAIFLERGYEIHLTCETGPGDVLFLMGRRRKMPDWSFTKGKGAFPYFLPKKGMNWKMTKKGRGKSADFSYFFLRGGMGGGGGGRR